MIYLLNYKLLVLFLIMFDLFDIKPIQEYKYFIEVYNKYRKNLLQTIYITSYELRYASNKKFIKLIQTFPNGKLCIIK